MYLELGEDLKEEILKEIYVDFDFIENMINIEQIPEVIKELIYKIHKQEEEFEDYKRNVEDCYRPKTPEEMYDCY